MPYLEYRTPNQAPRQLRLTRQLTTLGSSPDNHIVIDEPGIAAAHATILHDKGVYRIKTTARSLAMRVTGKKTRDRVLAHGDIISFGDVELSFSSLAPQNATTSPSEARLHKALDIHARLLNLSQTLLEERDASVLLRTLMDDVIALCQADKGFLVLSHEEGYRVCVSRRPGGQDIPQAKHLLSDKVVRLVLETREPQYSANASLDPRFCKSQSVIDLKLSSVMCVPLVANAKLLGLLYVGSDRPTHQFSPADLETLRIFAAQAALLVQTAHRLSDLRNQQDALEQRIEQMRFGALIGACPQMLENFRRIEKVAPTDMPVWLHGEPGTGKELLARELHRRSERAAAPFVCFNCAVIPGPDLERELFGQHRGPSPYLGAIDRAAAGTLYLAEIESLPPALQLRLLEAMQDKSRVTSSHGEARVITASNLSPTELLSARKLREELFFRLRVVDLALPPLRERGADLPLIARYLLNREQQGHDASSSLVFSKDALQAMTRFSWPGNIRQLENHIKKAVVLSDGPELSASDLGLALPSGHQDKEIEIIPLSQAKDAWQQDYINQVLALNDGNRAKTARDLGVDPRTIFRHLERLERQKQERAS